MPRLVRALIDTGATTTFVSKSVIDDLELDPRGTSHVHSATSAREFLIAPTYSIDLDLAGDITGSVARSLWVTGAQDLSAFGVEALLGWDVMRLWRLEFDGSAGTFCLTLP